MKLRSLHISFIMSFISYAVGAQIKSDPQALNNASVRSDSSFHFVKAIPGNYIALNVDILDNLYLITSNNQLKKINSNGDSVAAFNDVKKYGNPSLLDVNNPLKVLLYYKNYATVVVLDRLLTQRNSINFRKQSIFSVQAIATSYDNNIWVFDEQDLKLKKIDETGKLLQESADMRQLVDSVPSPQLIIDSDNLVYLYDEQKGFYIFDYYGALKNRLTFLNWTDIAISHNKIMGFSNNKLYSYELRSLNLKSYTLPAFFKDYNAIKAVNGKVYLLKKDVVEIYSVQ
ncbi:hypothetical protein BH11BAC4_BH11BAC4_02510 [soil metagenome]